MRTNLPAAFEDEDISGEKEAECEKHPKGKAEHVAAYPDHFPEKSLFIRVSRCHRVARQGRLGCRGTHKNIGFLIRSGTRGYAAAMARACELSSLLVIAS